MSIFLPTKKSNLFFSVLITVQFSFERPHPRGSDSDRVAVMELMLLLWKHMKIIVKVLLLFDLQSNPKEQGQRSM
jgi:hypothetical protein